MPYLNTRLGFLLALVLIVAAHPRASGAPELSNSPRGLETQAPKEGIHLYDTETSELTSGTVSAPTGWKEVGAGRVDWSFKGAASVSNGYLTLVLGKKSRGPECYYRNGAQMTFGLTLVAAGAGGDRAKTITNFRVIDNKPTGVVVEAIATSESGLTITTRYLVKGNLPMVEVQPGAGTESIFVEASGKYAVLPDVFAGDLVVSASDAAAPELRFPSERMLLQLVEGGNAIVECTWPSSEQQVRLFLRNRTFVGSEIACSKASGHNVSVAVLAAPAIWHEQILSELDPVKDLKLNWRVPFQALWRADFPRTDGFIDSWKCIIRKSKDDYERFGITTNLNMSRTVWTTARGSFAYPACIDGDRCLLRKTEFEEAPEIRYDDRRSVVIYPYRAINGGPAYVHGAVDLLCDALADTPQAPHEDDLDVKSVPRDIWPATCDVTANYEDIFDAGEEGAKKAFVLQRLDAMNNFVIGIRYRIDEYLDWSHETKAFCSKTKATQPQLAVLVDELEGYLAMIDRVYQERKLEERNPAAVHALIDKVIALIDSNDPKKSEKAKEIGRETRTIGGSQDHSIGEFRMYAKQLRQRAGYRMIDAKDDAEYEFASAIRQRTMKILQSGFVHEFATTD